MIEGDDDMSTYDPRADDDDQPVETTDPTTAEPTSEPDAGTTSEPDEERDHIGLTPDEQRAAEEQAEDTSFGGQSSEPG